MKMLLFTTLFVSTIGFANAGAAQCNRSSDATGSGNTSDKLKSINISHQYQQGKTATFKRQYVLKHSQSSCASSSTPYKKLVVVLHGGGGSGCRMRDKLEVNNASGVGGQKSAPYVTNDCINGNKTLYVFPNGLRAMDHPKYRKNGSLLFSPDYFKGTNSNHSARQFNDGRDPNNLIKESKFIEGIYNQLNGTTVNGAKVKFDGSIYLAGHSNGAGMQWKTLSESKKVKALFMSAGLMPERVPQNFPLKSQQAHIFMVQGRQDGMQHFDGTPGSQLGAYATVEEAASQYGYHLRKNKNTWSYGNVNPTKNDKHANYMKDTFYPSYPPPKGKKLVLLSEVGRIDKAKGDSFGAGHCWHGQLTTTKMEIEGEQVTEECTAKYASTFWMIYSFSEADKWDKR